jgi:hypothetical protein
MSIFLQNFPQKLEKMVKITLEKNIYPKIVLKKAVFVQLFKFYIESSFLVFFFFFFLGPPDLRCWLTNCRWCQLQSQRSAGIFGLLIISIISKSVNP